MDRLYLTDFVTPLERGAKTPAVEEAFKAGKEQFGGMRDRRGREQEERDCLG